jgi:acyl dehydratase
MTLDLSLKGRASAPWKHSYTWKDTVLYALGVGSKKDESDYLFEGRGPRVLPTYAVIAKQNLLLNVLRDTGCDLRMVVHHRERVVLHALLPSAGTLVTTATIRDIYDMRRFALLVVDTRSEDDEGRLVAETTSSILLRGEGGFGGETAPRVAPRMDRPAERPPAFVIEEATVPEQALLYRLSGDENQIHADDEFAKSAGFERGALLHGLCTFGFMARHVAKAVCHGDATRIREIEGQFRRPVWPGDTLCTEGWHVGTRAVALQVRVKERDEIVISGASATFCLDLV